MEVDAKEEYLEELDVFEEENFIDTDIVHEVFDDDDELLTCQYFTAIEWVKYYQLTSYFCVVKLSETEQQIETEWKTTYLVDDSVELVDFPVFGSISLR